MRSAKEWVKEQAFQIDKTPPDEVLIKLIEEIQLDAWEQGQKDAASYVGDGPIAGEKVREFILAEAAKRCERRWQVLS